MISLDIQFKDQFEGEDLLLVPLERDQPFPPYLQQIDTALQGGVLFNRKRENFQKGDILEMTTNGLHPIARIILVGIGNQTPLEIGGQLATLLKGEKIAIVAPSEWLADIAFGLKLRAWHFTKYMTENVPKPKRIHFITQDPAKSAELFRAKEQLYQGVALARELTVEPANALYPDAFAQRCLQLREEGVRWKCSMKRIWKE